MEITVLSSCRHGT